MGKREMGVRISSPIESADVEKHERQCRDKAINSILDACEVLITEVRMLVTEEIKKTNTSLEDKRIFWHFIRLAQISLFLVTVGRQSEVRAKNYEDRLEELEKQMEELKKRLPTDDGK